jgi:hypothetical protein
LAADQGLFPAFESGKKLHGSQESQVISDSTHDCWMLPALKSAKH